MARKLLLIFASLTLVIAGGALYLSLSQGTSQASGSTRQVLVATGDIAPGTPADSLTDASVRTVQVDLNAAPASALPALTKVAGLITTVPIFTGQVLIPRQFATAAATGGLPIPPGTNAVSVEFNDPARVAGFVQPGSKVIIYNTAGGTGTVLLPSASVIAVGPATAIGKGADSANKSVPSTIVTFALTPRDAAKLVAVPSSSLYLGLLPK